MPSLHGAPLGGMRWIAKNVRGIRTVLKRRGAGYFTAFCSLYYLPPQDMAAIVTRAAKGGATLLLQANEAIGSNRPGTADDLLRLMRDYGYPTASVHAPLGYSRPLLVGMRPEGPTRAG
jgi:hypothetical protein